MRSSGSRLSRAVRWTYRAFGRSLPTGERWQASSGGGCFRSPLQLPCLAVVEDLTKKHQGMATPEQWMAKLARLKVDKARGDPAPHKPLLLLIVLELAEQG